MGSHRKSWRHVGQRAGAFSGALFGLALWGLAGCGLGYIEIPPFVTFVIENPTPETTTVTLTVGAATAQAGEDSDVETIVNVPGRNTASGKTVCGQKITLSVAIEGGFGTSIVELSGDGTGTPGFDSGTVGSQGERFLFEGEHFACSDSILIRIESTESGEVSVIAPGASIPDPIDSVEPTDPETGDRTLITVRLENGTATAADFLITASEDEEDGGTSRSSNTSQSITAVRVPAGEFSVGKIACGPAYVFSGTMVTDSASAVQYGGDGTGTAGFDGTSMGPDGERLLIFGDHYACGDLIVVRVTDDGSGIGPNTSEAPQGDVRVFGGGEPVPEPDLPDPDDLADPESVEFVTFAVVNSVESTVQINVATGSGALASGGGTEVASEFDVRVPPGAQSAGTVACAQEYVIAAAHLQARTTTAEEDTGDGLFAGEGSAIFHSVVLTGAGTGTEGFDSNSLAIRRGRLLQLGTHFECGDTISVVVAETNNQIMLNSEGEPMLDGFGTPIIQYQVGSGFVTVTPGP